MSTIYEQSKLILRPKGYRAGRLFNQLPSTPSVYDSEKAVNGTFTGSVTGWTLQAGIAYGANNLVFTSTTSGNTATNSSMVDVVAGKTYKVEFEISAYSAGAIIASIGGASGTARSTNGKFVVYLTATTTAVFSFAASGTTTLTVDTVSVKEVISLASDFNVNRNSYATRVRSDGKLERLGANVPLLDYSGGSTPVLLTQPQRSNLITSPITMKDWTLSGATLEGDPSTAESERITVQNNRDFSDGTIGNWIVGTNGNGTVTYDATKAAGKITIGATTGTFTLAELASGNATALVVGETYKFSVDIWDEVGNVGSLQLNVYDNVTNYNHNISPTKGQWVTINFYFTATGTGTRLRVYDYSTASGNIVYFDNISIKKVTGFASPSVDFPFAALKLVESSANEAHYLSRGLFSVTDATNYTLSFFSNVSSRYIQVVIGGIVLVGGNQHVNFLNGVVTGGGGTYTTKITQLADSFYKYDITVTTAAAGLMSVFVILQNSPTAARLATYTGDGTSGVYIAFAQLEEGANATTPILPASVAAEGSIVTRLIDNTSVTVPAGVTEITETVNGVDTVITTIPATYTMKEGYTSKVIMI